MDFPDAINAQLSGAVVRRATLVEFDFKSGPKRVWNGAGKLKTQDGRIWEGLFGLGSIEGLQQAINGATPEQRYIVSGVDPTFAAKAKAEDDQYINRLVRVFCQFFDADWQTLDQPFALAWGIMRSLSSKRRSTERGFEHTVTIKAESPFGATKRRPRFAYCTDRDQKLRYPGDRGMERVAGIDMKLINFPAV